MLRQESQGAVCLPAPTQAWERMESGKGGCYSGNVVHLQRCFLLPQLIRSAEAVSLKNKLLFQIGHFHLSEQEKGTVSLTIATIHSKA